MEKYNHCTLQDLVWDNQFREWVLTPTIESNIQWETWLMGHPDKKEMIQEATQIINALKIKEPTIQSDEIKRLVQKTIQKIGNSRKLPQYTEGSAKLKTVFYRQTWFRVAASVALILSLGWGAWSVQKTNQSGRIYGNTVSEATNYIIEKVNTTDVPQTVHLSDGSVVTLKKGSRISFDSIFSGDKRVVYLSGEAFFEVAKNPKKPFIVYANELITKVLGTSFTIKAYKEDREVTVEVKTGKVSVFTRKNEPQIAETNMPTLKGLVLMPNQKIVFNREIEQLTKTLVEKPEIIITQNEKTTWNFDFDDTPASEVFRILKEAYSINIIYDEAVLKDCPVTAPLTDQSLYDKLKIICKAINAQYEVLDGQIVIQSNGCK